MSRRSRHVVPKVTPFYQALEPRTMLAVVQVFAAGETNQETVQLQIDGAVVATWNDLGGNAGNGQFSTYSFSTAGPVTASQIRVSFTNDIYDPGAGIDRNVRIDAIAIDGVRYETEAPQVFSTGTWLPQDGIVPGYRQSEYLHANGYFQFAETGGTGPQIQLRVAGSEGGEQGELRVNGALIGSFVATQAYQLFSFQLTQPVTPDQVQVFFTNDAYDPTISLDRNLSVDFLSIDGVIYQTESASVYSTGTWRLDDGIVPGFRLSETLHTNGYFRYGQSSQPGVFSLSIASLSVREDQGQLSVVVFRSSGSDGTVSVDYATQVGTATAADFTPRTGTLTFAPGVNSLSFNVTILDDSSQEPSEEFSITLLNPVGGATLGSITTQTVTITDNDQALAGTIYREGFEETALWTVNPYGTDSATSGNWQTGAPQGTSSTGSPVQFDSGFQSPRALVTGLVAGANVDTNDVDGGITSALSPLITLPASPDLELTFQYNFAHGSNSSAVDYLRLYVVSGSGTNQVFSVAGQSTNVYADWKTATVNLSPYSGQSIRLLVQASDLGGASTVEAAIDDVTIEAYENNPGTLSIAETDVFVDEAAGQALVTVSRTLGRQGLVSINYQTIFGSATAEDFTAVNGTVTFANGETRKTIAIPITNDTTQEQLESFQFELINPTGGALLGANRIATVTIVDNDNAVQDYLPDLLPIEATLREQIRIDTTQISGRKLLRFSAEVANRGSGPLEVWGGAASGTSQQVFQRIYQANNASRDRLSGNFVYHSNHGHIHLEGLATYNLRQTSDSQSIVASGGKTSFCLLNLRQPFPDDTAAAARVHGRGGNNCGQIQGISAGYSDVYSANLDGQWIDITGIADGTYWLEIIVDPAGNLQELDEGNNTARIPVTISNGSVIAATEAAGTPVSLTDQYSATGTGTIVAMIDSGIDLQNSQLVGNLWNNRLEIANDNIDNDGNGFVDDLHGFDFVDNDGSVSDLNGHGTFVAGMLAGARGIAPDAELMIIRALDQYGRGTDESVAAGIRYAVDNGADVISLPLSSGGSQAIVAALDYARLHDVLIVAAAGNEGGSTPGFIAALSSEFANVLSVGGLTADGQLLPESNRVGASHAIQIDATGVAMSTILDGQFATFRGTSIAAGLASAAAALALSANNNLTAAQLRDVLVVSAGLVGPLSDSRGTLDIQAAIDLAAWSSAVTVTRIGTTLSIGTSSSSDTLRLDQRTILINGIRYEIPGDITDVLINDPEGADRIHVIGTNDPDSAWIQNSFAKFVTPTLNFTAYGFEFASFDGRWGQNSLTIHDTAGDDSFYFSEGRASLSSAGIFRGGIAVEQIRVVGSQGFDSATLVGSDQDDRFYGNHSLGRISRNGLLVQVSKFDQITADLRGGVDISIVDGSPTTDRVELHPGTARYTNDVIEHFLTGLEQTTSNGLSGDDEISVWGSASLETINFRPGNTLWVGPTYRHRIFGFETTRLYSGGGSDRATLTGTPGDDRLSFASSLLTYDGNGFLTKLTGFTNLSVFGNGGNDLASLQGSAQNESLFHSPLQTSFRSDDVQLVLRDFAVLQIFGGGGTDTATLVDDASDDQLLLSRQQAELRTARQQLVVAGFQRVRARSQLDLGQDVIRRLDSQLDYAFEQFGDWIDE